MTALPPRVLFLARQPQRRARFNFEGLYVGFIFLSLVKLLKILHEIILPPPVKKKRRKVRLPTELRSLWCLLGAAITAPFPVKFVLASPITGVEKMPNIRKKPI